MSPLSPSTHAPSWLHFNTTDHQDTATDPTCPPAPSPSSSHLPLEDQPTVAAGRSRKQKKKGKKEEVSKEEKRHKRKDKRR